MKKLVGLFGLLTACAWSQSESGSSALTGTVLDPAGRGVSGATLEVVQKETGYRRKTLSDSEGRFSAPVLPVGVYSVETTASGFAKGKLDGVVLAVGESQVVTIRLALAAVDQQVTVSDQVSAVEPDQTATATSIGTKAIETLPIRGRNFTEFAQLTPAVVQESDRFGLVFAGQRSINSNVAVDGADFNDPLQGNQRGGNAPTFFFPQSAVREFQVVRSGATAEVGRTNAGFVNVVTRGGGNQFSGDLFYFNRNKTLTSPDAFGRKLNNRQNQFGGSIGGPLKKDKAFFFVAAEQNLLRVPFVVQFQRQAANVTVPADLLALQGEQRGTNSPFALYVREDTNLSEKHSLNFTYNYSRSRGENFNFDSPQIDSAVSTNYLYKGDSHAGKVSLVSVLTPRLINEARGQIATDNRIEDPNSNVAQIVINGFGTIGGDSGRPRRFDSTRYQVQENMTWTRGRSQLRFGVDVNVNALRQQRESNIQGRYDFTSLTNYSNRNISRFRQTLTGFDPKELIFSGHQQEAALFVTEKLSLRRDLTLTAGLRWEGQWNPQPTRPNPLVPQTAKIPNDLGMWQPRVGLSWAPGKGNTVVRLSGGLFSARTPANLFQRVFTNNGLTALAVDSRFDPAILPLLRFPNPLATLPPSIRVPVQRVFGFDRAFVNPQSAQFSATVEQAFGQETVLSVGYIRNATWHLQRRLDRNLFPPVINAAGVAIFPTTRPNPAIGWLSVNEATAHSTYDGLVLTVRRRFSRRFQMQANYTFAKNYDDDSNERNFSRETTLNVYDLKAERAPSKQDVRHNFNVSGLVNVPWKFTFSGIAIARSGFPYTATIGFDTQNDGNDDNDRAILNGKVVGRNSFRQPKFFDLDLRIQRGFKFGERRELLLSAEGFNVTKAANRNFGNDSISLFGTAAAPVATAGQALFAPSTARYGGPRQLQLGARFVF